MEHLTDYWKGEKLPADRLAAKLRQLETELQLLIPRKPTVPRDNPVDGFVPKNLNCQTFKGLGQVSLGFAPGLTLLVGANNSGKSSLMQAAHWALTGELPKVDNNDLIQWGADSCEVNLVSSTASITRRFKDTRMTVLAEINGAKANAVKKVEELFTSEVGDPKVIAANSLVPQGEMTALLDDAPGVRQAALYKFIGLAGYEPVRVALAKALATAEAAGGAETKGIDAEAAKLRAEIAALPPITVSVDQVAEKRAFLLQMQGKCVGWENQLSSLRAEEKQVVLEGQKVRDLPDCCPTCGEMGVVCHLPPQAKEAKRDQLKGRWCAINTEVDALVKDISSMKVDITRAERELTAINQQYDALNLLQAQLKRLESAKAATVVGSGNKEHLLDLAVLVQTFSRAGFPAWEAKKHLASINQIAAEIQGDDVFRWAFAEDLSIVAHQSIGDGEPGKLTPRCASGSSRMRGALALRAALSIYEGRMRGMANRFLWIDEFPYQDGDNEHVSIEMFIRLAVMVGTVVVNVSKETVWTNAESGYACRILRMTGTDGHLG